MTNQELVNRLSELVGKLNGSTLALSPSHIVDERLEQELNQLIESVKQQERTTKGTQRHTQAALGLISGLYLWNGSLESSHVISQDLENSTGSYLHGILHRIEPDYSNAKYWFRMAGGHPDGERLQQDTLNLLRESASINETLFQSFANQTGWNPALFTDMAATFLQKRIAGKEGSLLERIQAMELHLLLEAEIREMNHLQR
jgi:hypothetical protein